MKLVPRFWPSATARNDDGDGDIPVVAATPVAAAAAAAPKATPVALVVHYCKKKRLLTPVTVLCVVVSLLLFAESSTFATPGKTRGSLSASPLGQSQAVHDNGNLRSPETPIKGTTHEEMMRLLLHSMYLPLSSATTAMTSLPSRVQQSSSVTSPILTRSACMWRKLLLEQSSRYLKLKYNRDDDTTSAPSSTDCESVDALPSWNTSSVSLASLHKTIYGGAVEWEVVVQTSRSSEKELPKYNSETTSIEKASSCVISILLSRSRLQAPIFVETADTDEYPEYPLSSSVQWQDVIRNRAGPDAFHGVLMGPELVPFSIRRLPKAESSLPQKKSNNIIVNNNSDRIDPVVYGLVAQATLNGTYVIHLEHRFFNHGALHDRDTYANPYIPVLTLGKSNSWVRAGAIKPSRQRLQLVGQQRRSTSTSSKSSKRSSSGQGPPDVVHCAVTSPRSQATVEELPKCSERFVTAQRRKFGLPSVSALSGRYVDSTQQLSPAGVACLAPMVNVSCPRKWNIRGWHVDTKYPLNDVQYVWCGYTCNTVAYLPGATCPSGDDVEEDHRGTRSSNHNARVHEAMVNSLLLDESHSESDPMDNPSSSSSSLKKCLLKKNMSILLLGDSHVRSVFHTFVSLLTGTRPFVGKMNYGRLLLSRTNRSSDDQGRGEEPRYTSDARYGTCLDHPHCWRNAERTYVEYVWDPLLLNLSVASRLSARSDHRRDKSRRLAQLKKMQAMNGTLLFPEDAASRSEKQQHDDIGSDSQLDKEVGRGTSNASRSSPLSSDTTFHFSVQERMWLDQEEEEEDDPILRTLEDDHILLGPDANLRTMSPLVQSALGFRGGGAAADDDAAPPPASPDVIVVGCGGWFGIHHWHMDDVEAHFRDVVDALRRLTAQRVRNGLPKPLILFLASPAWPSYVTWEGHRRNTNYRLGALTQLTRWMLEDVAAAQQLRLVNVPFFEMSLPVSHMQMNSKEIHYDGSMVVFQLVDMIGTLMCE